MTIEMTEWSLAPDMSSPAEMVTTEHDTLRPEAPTGAQTPKAKRKKSAPKKTSRVGSSKPKSAKPKKSTRSAKPSKKGASKSRTTGAPRSTRKTSKPEKSPKGVRTTTRTGKKITRAKAGGKGVLASKGLHLLVVRVPEKVRDAAWRKAKKLGIPLNRWLNTLIEKGAK